MDALDTIRQRLSVRQYTDRPVAERDLDRLLRLALLAPTGHNAQAWSFVVVREPERRARPKIFHWFLEDEYRELLGIPPENGPTT